MAIISTLTPLASANVVWGETWVSIVKRQWNNVVLLTVQRMCLLATEQGALFEVQVHAISTIIYLPYLETKWSSETLPHLVFWWTWMDGRCGTQSLYLPASSLFLSVSVPHLQFRDKELLHWCACVCTCNSHTGWLEPKLLTMFMNFP